MMIQLVDMDSELKVLPQHLVSETGQESTGIAKRKIIKLSSDTYKNIEESGNSWQKGVAHWGPVLVMFFQTLGLSQLWFVL